jgi:hypothetical protein
MAFDVRGVEWMVNVGLVTFVRACWCHPDRIYNSDRTGLCLCGSYRAERVRFGTSALLRKSYTESQHIPAWHDMSDATWHTQKRK